MAKKTHQLIWIRTTGGPHLVVSKKHAIHWEGVAEPSHGRRVKAKSRYDRTIPATDYDRACDIDGLQGALRIGRGRGLVLSDNLTKAAYYCWQERHFILRWVYAPSESALLKFFHSIVEQHKKPKSALSYRHTGGPMILCDSSDIPRSWLGDYFEFELPIGDYSVTAFQASDDDCSIIVHELQ
jgi:hypothetical protein